MSRKTKKFLVITNFEYGTRVMHSYSIMSEKEIEKFDRRMEKHFNDNHELIIQFGERPEEYIVIETLEDVYEHIDIENIGKASARVITDLLGVEIGEFGIDTLYGAALEQKIRNKEQKNRPAPEPEFDAFVEGEGE